MRCLPTLRRWFGDCCMERDDPYRILFQLNFNPMWVYDGETLACLAVDEGAMSELAIQVRSVLDR